MDRGTDRGQLGPIRRIIILRHGEKATAYKLCDIGRERAEALATTYLGRGAAKSLFSSGEAPAAILAITLHTLELASPSAASWGEPLTLSQEVSSRHLAEKVMERVAERSPIGDFGLETAPGKNPTNSGARRLDDCAESGH